MRPPVWTVDFQFDVTMDGAPFRCLGFRQAWPI
ncbi:hypothetical protein X011_16610 [Mycobacterium tuberculosis variant microti OV254]|nr:hypothetical protein X011_16610 [Mycobacterium tuberculosis variant microti OV254]